MNTKSYHARFGTPKMQRMKEIFTFHPLILLHGGDADTDFTSFIYRMCQLNEVGGHYIGKTLDGGTFALFHFLNERNKVKLMWGEEGNSKDRTEKMVKKWIENTGKPFSYYIKAYNADPFFLMKYDEGEKDFKFAGSFGCIDFAILKKDFMPENTTIYQVKGSALRFWIATNSRNYAERKKYEKCMNP